MGKKLLVGECKWTEGEDADKLTFELMEKARKLPFLKKQEIVPVLFLKRAPVHGSGALVITPQQVIDTIDNIRFKRASTSFKTSKIWFKTDFTPV